MKIAICLSGLPRTGNAGADFIMPYFNIPGWQVDYFCHTWDTDLNKNRDGGHSYIDVDRIMLNQMLSKFNPISTQVDNQSIIDSWPNIHTTHNGHKNHWAPLFYSCMMANHLKRRHEQIIGEKYDIVIKARYDSVFKPGSHFTLLHINPDEIYTSHSNNFPYEFGRRNFSDVYFAGSSEVMDIACDYFRYIAFNSNGGADHEVGPGVGLYKYLIDRNITTMATLDYETILRPEALGDLTWSNIVAVHQSFYK